MTRALAMVVAAVLADMALLEMVALVVVTGYVPMAEAIKAVSR